VILVHWITAVLIALAVAVALGREWLDGDLVRQRLLDLHRLLGLGVLGLSVSRLVLSRAFGAAKVNEHSTPVIGLMAAMGHGALYLALVVVPLLGWAQWSASGKAMTLFGILPIPALLGRNRDLAETLAQAHQVVAWLFLGLIAAHAVAALWHHYHRRDQVMRSMLPGRLALSTTRS
jgi:cytochrome b561